MKKEKIIEIGAVIASLVYTYLYLNQNRWCFLFGILSPLMFLNLAWRKKIYADVLLQVFYVVVTVYGFFQLENAWTRNYWTLGTHYSFIVAGACIALASGYLLSKKTDASLPYLDSFVTSYAIIATWMMMNFVHENWLYFIVVNLASIALFTLRRLYLGALMFVVYLLMSIDGYYELHIFGS